ncbi:MAG TPA: methyl-accepting chemotaxis protein [Aquabacterium sp.]|uniref:methyl-accepting chemotaxis protein n=1 Tax=Aquabacterium sp. TaxID=1872578 RepID=UPI002E31E80B|nr:methyl-accepting chemotaxis protein [Aquabacterium sp.]HEX5358175.1 methyl-accepting chemotaxis protein [Aquabacterium sp.]
MGHPSFLQVLLRPGMRLMRVLPYRAKRTLLYFMLVAPALGMSWWAASFAPAERQAGIWLTGGAVAALALYLGGSMLRNTHGAMRVLQASVAQLAAGDFATRIRLRATDELYDMGHSLDQTTGYISQMVSDIRSNSAMVAQAGIKLADDTQALADRTDAQARRLEQTASHVRDINLALSTSAASAMAVDQTMSDVRHMAEDGGVAVNSAVASVLDIQSSSRRVQEIIGVIEGIAFQTNILALNAAVEAARAGEQGRGFAVVASEVRSLAQRSATAAKEIRQLIGESVHHVETGVAQINGTHETFERIVNGIRSVAAEVRSIAASSQEQSAALGEVAQAVAQLDEITQQNARMVEQASHSSTQLSERAHRLAEAVESFRLRQGSADEAMALVNKAVQLYKSHGLQALDMITRDDKSFVDRDMYVFAFDRQGRYRALAGKVDKVGTAVRDNPGVDGDRLVSEAFDRATHGGGWVDYAFTNPQTGVVDLKTSYVEPVADDLLIGCGVYKARGQTAADLVAALAPRVIRSEQRQVLGVASRKVPGKRPQGASITNLKPTSV